MQSGSPKYPWAIIHLTQVGCLARFLKMNWSDQCPPFGIK
jgi:hypothetical protein